MNKSKLNGLLTAVVALVATGAHASVVTPDVVDATQQAPHAVSASENFNQQYTVTGINPSSTRQTGIKGNGTASEVLPLSKHYTGKFVSLDVGTHYNNEDTTIGASIGTEWKGYEITAGFVNGKYKTEGNGLFNPVEMVKQTTYSVGVWKPFLSGETYDLSLGGSLSRTIFDEDEAKAYIVALDRADALANKSITSTYLSLRARSAVSNSIGVYVSADYNVWNNHDMFSNKDSEDLHKPVTLKAGIDYTIAKGAQIGLNASVGTKFDTSYTASFKYMF